MGRRDVLLLALLLTSGCAPKPKVIFSPIARCADGAPPLILTDPKCPPNGICGYSCLPDRWCPR